MQKLVEYADELVSSVGPRPGASKGEHQAAELIATNLERLGLDAWIQEFSSARSTGWVRILYYVLGVVAAELLFALPDLKVLAFVLVLLAAALLLLDLLGKNPLYNLLNRGLSQNVVARYVPEGADPRRKVVVVAHYDSGRSMLQCAPPLVPFYRAVREGIRICVGILLLVTLLSLFPFPEVGLLLLSVIGLIAGILLLIAAAIEIINLFMPYNQGANCNASGVAAIMGVAETLVGRRGEGTASATGVAGTVGAEWQRGEAGKRQSRTPRARRKVAAGYEESALSSHEEQQDSSEAFAREEEDRYLPEVEYEIARRRLAPEDTGGAGRSASATAAQGSTADLGREVPAAARAAASRVLPGSYQEARQERRSVGGSPVSLMPTYAKDAVPHPDNPAIRTRPPLAEQEESERALQAEVEARASDKINGVPAWFINAKKAAHKDEANAAAGSDATGSAAPRPAHASTTSSKTAGSAAAGTIANSTKSGGVKVARSRYADVPLTYKPEPAISPAEEQAQRREQLEQAQASAPLATPLNAGAQQAATQASAGRQISEQELPLSHVQPGEPQGRQQNKQQDRQTSLPRSTVQAEAPTTLQADFSGLDRLASDPVQPLVAPRQSARLPKSASMLEQATAVPKPDIPTNDRLRNLPSMSLGSSGAIPTQQAAFDQPTLFATSEPSQSDTKVSNTGSFAPLGATGIMKPVGEELLNYHEDEQDIYIHDADESGHTERTRGSGSDEYSPHMVEMPKSRARSFFGGLGGRLSGKRKAENLDTTPASWLGVDDTYDARTEGSQIGSWENFSEEESSGWKGGAYGGESYEENAQALSRFSSILIDKEVWIVALGSHENKNAGIKSLLAEYERELKSALIINVDGVGAGNLFYTMAEGSFRPHGTDHRLQGLIKSAAQTLGVHIAPSGFRAYNTDAALALRNGARAISIVGLDGQLPAGWRWSDDRLDVLEEDNLQAVADVVVEVIKSI